MKKIKPLNNLAETMKKHMGSEDYRNASGVMRQVLVNVVNVLSQKMIEKGEGSYIFNNNKRGSTRQRTAAGTQTR